MKEKQLKRLAQLSLEERLDRVAEGIALLSSNVAGMLREYDEIWDEAPRAALLLKNLAEEEAAKAFILVDYCRPAAGVSPAQISQHLSRAYDHLARGIYATYYGTRPASFREVARFVDRERVSFYLDGPEGFEWIFRNSILQRREDALYVDFVERDDGLRWQSPEYFVALAKPIHGYHPRVCTLLIAMESGGLLSAASLRSLRELWGGVQIEEDTHWQECGELNKEFIRRIRDTGVDIPDELAHLVRWQFLFPLVQLDLSKQEVDRQALSEERDEALRNWDPW